MPSHAHDDAPNGNVELFTLNAQPTMLDFLSSVPPVVTKLLVELGPVIRFLRWFAQAASWKTPAEQSWLLLFAWWALCTLLPSFIRFTIIPAVIFGPVLVHHLPKWAQPSKKKAEATTEQVLAKALTDLEVINSLIPHDIEFKDLLPKDFTWNERARLFAVIGSPYIALTYAVPVSVLIASFGSVFLTWRSSWVQACKRIVVQSAHVRAAWRTGVGYITGNYSIPLKFTTKSKATIATVEDSLPKPKQHRFVFTVLENQRWWVGIDWTAALLPSERPSWCSPATTASIAAATSSSGASKESISNIVHQPLQPPSSFPLPSSSSVILPSSNGKGFIKKKATWKWEDESEWEVVVRKEGDTHSKRFKPPRASSNQAGTSTTGGQPAAEEEGRGSRFMKSAVSKLNLGTTPTSPAATSSDNNHGTKDDGEEDKHKIIAEDDEDLLTDAEGWIYGDNKWENLTGKAGIGKYTRFRRWCRVAVLVEEEEPWSESDPSKDTDTQPKFYTIPDNGNKTGGYDVGKQRARVSSIGTDSTGSSSSPERKLNISGAETSTTTVTSEPEEGGIRQRLKAAWKG